MARLDIVSPPNGQLAVVSSVALERAMVPGSDLSADDSVRLIERIANHGDRQAFAALFRHFAPRLKAYLRRMGAAEGLAEELAQEVMLIVWRRAPQFDHRQAGASTWIFTIARNKRIDSLRRERRPEFDPDDPTLVPEPLAAADRTVELGQQEERLKHAVTALPQEQSRLLHMAYFEDKSHSHIAAELGLPLGTVKSRLRLALARLRTMLEGVQ